MYVSMCESIVGFLSYVFSEIEAVQFFFLSCLNDVLYLSLLPFFSTSECFTFLKLTSEFRDGKICYDGGYHILSFWSVSRLGVLETSSCGFLFSLGLNDISSGVGVFFNSFREFAHGMAGNLVSISFLTAVVKLSQVFVADVFSSIGFSKRVLGVNGAILTVMRDLSTIAFYRRECCMRLALAEAVLSVVCSDSRGDDHACLVFDVIGTCLEVSHSVRLYRVALSIKNLMIVWPAMFEGDQVFLSKLCHVGSSENILSFRFALVDLISRGLLKPNKYLYMLGIGLSISTSGSPILNYAMLYVLIRRCLEFCNSRDVLLYVARGAVSDTDSLHGSRKRLIADCIAILDLSEVPSVVAGMVNGLQ